MQYNLTKSLCAVALVATTSFSGSVYATIGRAHSKIVATHESSTVVAEEANVIIDHLPIVRDEVAISEPHAQEIKPISTANWVNTIGKIGKEVGITNDDAKAVTALVRNIPSRNEKRELECLAMNILREAGAESDEGKIGVAQVTLNRVDDPKYPKDVCSVVHQKKLVGHRYICQFSWYCSKHRTLDVENYKHCYAIAEQVMISGYRLRKFKGALYYHTVAVKPSWRKRLAMIGRTGNHLFYRNRAETGVA